MRKMGKKNKKADNPAEMEKAGKSDGICRCLKRRAAPADPIISPAGTVLSKEEDIYYYFEP